MTKIMGQLKNIVQAIGTLEDCTLELALLWLA